MKKTKLTRSLLAACSIVALSVALSGCLHSGDDDTMDAGGEMPPTVDGNLTLAGVTAGEAIMPGTYMVDSALAAAFADAPEGLAGVEHAMGAMVTVGGVNLTCAMGPCQVDLNDDGTVTVTGTIHTADYTPPAPPPTEEEIAEEIAENMALAVAINAADDDATPSETSDDVRNMDTAVALVSDGKPADDSELEMSDMDIADLGTGWTGSAYDKMTEAMGTGATMTRASTDTVVIYNNKGDDVQVGYVMHYTDDAPTGVSLTAATGVLEFSATADQDLGSQSDLVSLTGVTATTNYDDTPDDMTNNDGAASSVMGSFHGLPGTFACTSGPCQIVPVAGGGYVTDGTWTFTPTVDANEPIEDELEALMVTIDDPDYMYIGYWINRSTDAMGDSTAEANVFFGGTVASQVATDGAAVDGYQDLEGQASYAGPATGAYVLKSFDERGTGTVTAAGQFTATANLTATFGAPDTVASVNHNAISGMITDFMANGEMIDADWSLDLQNANIGATDGPTDAAPMFSGMTQETDNMEGDLGAWRGQLFGEVTDDDVDTTDMDETIYPSGVAGEFTGHFQNGHVLGGFGAEYVPEEN